MADYLRLSNMIVSLRLKRFYASCFVSLLTTISICFAQPGSVDVTWHAASISPGGTVKVLLVEPSGKVLIGGLFTNVNGVTRHHIARLLPDGSVDESFTSPLPSRTSGGEYPVNGIARQSDGKIVLVGSLQWGRNGQTVVGIVRLEQDGKLDPDFRPRRGVGGSVQGVQLYDDGKILIYGNFRTYDSISWERLGRLIPDGSLDTGFPIRLPSASPYPFAAVLQMDGGVVLNQIKMRRYFADGVLDEHFNESGIETVLKLYEISSSRLLGVRPGLYRADASGRRDPSFRHPLGDTGLADAAEQPDQKILVAGYFQFLPGHSNAHVVRLLSDGSIDAGFKSGLLGDPFHHAEAIVLQPDGQILVAGRFRAPEGQGRLGVIRLNGGDAANAPKIIEQPKDQVLAVGSTLELRGNISGAQPMSLQWKKNATPVFDATNAVLRIENLGPDHEGSYTLLASNEFGMAASIQVQVAMGVAPIVFAKPASVLGYAGTNLQFSVRVKSLLPVTYQWFRNEVKLAGETNSVIKLAAVRPQDSGRYRVQAANEFGITTSEEAAAVVLPMDAPGAVISSFKPSIFPPGSVSAMAIAPGENGGGGNICHERQHPPD